MSTMSWVTSWEAWRGVMGHAGSRQRRNVTDFLSTHPAVLYWGDSWFSTPLYLNLARQSARRIQGLSMIVGKPGAEAAELFSSREVERIGERVQNNPFDVVCLSAGGNDCLHDRLATVFSAWTDGTLPRRKKIGAAEAYRIFEDSRVLERVQAAYGRALERLKQVRAHRRHLRVVGHPYVPIQCVGRKAVLDTSNIGLIAWVKDSVGPWLWAPMKHVLTDQTEASEFARQMLEDGFRDGVLANLQQQYRGFFHVADFSGVQELRREDFWNDDIHPGEDGFGRLASPFNRTLRAVLPAAKQAAVSD